MTRMIQIKAETNNLLTTAFRKYTKENQYPKGGFTNDKVLRAALMAYIKQGDEKK